MTAPKVAPPPELDRSLRMAPDGDALRHVWDALPGAAATDDEANPSARAAAWAALRARLDDPNRVPYTDDVVSDTPALTLHEDREDAPATRATPVAPVGSLSSRGWRWSRRRSIGVLTGLAATLALVTWRAVPIAFTGAPGVAATRVTLADGSQVWLAEGATLTVPRALGWPSVWRTLRRDVTLTGTAFFTVARDGRDFAVRTPDAVVRVLGTRFEVRAQTAGSRVLVEEGHVSVTASRTQSRVELRAGEATRIVASPLAVTPVAVARVGTWREGGLAALDEPLREVLAELERRFHREITIDGDVMADAPVSLFYPRAPELETILTDLCTAHGLRFRQTSRGFVIMRGPGLE